MLYNNSHFHAVNTKKTELYYSYGILREMKYFIDSLLNIGRCNAGEVIASLIDSQSKKLIENELVIGRIILKYDKNRML